MALRTNFSGAIYFIAVMVASLPAQVAAREQLADEGSRNGNEILVTASKREHALQETPISVSVVDDDAVTRGHITDLIDLQTLVPSLKIRQFQNLGQANFQIRGFGNDANNIGVETSVGIFIDGVYRSRAASAIADLPEIERVEVLRGPQSTLFGKNVSAGVISIVTARPDPTQFKLKAEATLGNFNAREGKLVVNLPVSGTLALRLSGSLHDRDGYFRNTVAGGRVNGRNRYALRADIAFEPTDAIRFRLIADYDKIAEVCCGVVSLSNGPVTTNVIGGLLHAPIGDPNRIFDYDLVYDENPANRLVGKGASLQGDFELGFARLTSITALRRQTNDYTLDADFTGAKIVRQEMATRISSFSQEFRLASSGEGPLSWLAGAYFLNERFRVDGTSNWGSDGRRFIDGITGNAVSSLEKVLLLTATPGISQGQLIGPGQGASENYRMADRSYSLFAQLDYRIGNVTLSGGLAYGNDRKRARADNLSSDVFAGLNLNNLPQLAALGLPANSFKGLAQVQFFPQPVNFPNASETGVLKGDKLVYMARVSYRFSPQLSVYANISTGWKAGAYNLSRDSRPPDSNGAGRTAGPENVMLYELGLKADIGNMFLNIALFDQAIEGFQSNSFTGTGFSLVNAGQQSVRGAELDAGYRVTKALSFGAAVTYLDPKFDSFVHAPCVPVDPVRCGAGQLFRDLSGTRPADIPTWTVNLNGNYDFILGGGWRGYLHADYFYASRTFQALAVPAAIASVQANTVNASIGFGHDDLLDLQFWARNLTKDKYTRNAFPSVAQAGSFAAFPVEPRTYGVTLRRSF